MDNSELTGAAGTPEGPRRRTAPEHYRSQVWADDDEPEVPTSTKILRSIRETAVVIAIAVVVTFLIKTFFFRAFVIPSGSMEYTLQVDDRILVNQLVPGPFELERGDVIVFEDKQSWLPAQHNTSGAFAKALQTIGIFPDPSDQHLVKRIIGMPGDHVTVDEDSRNIVVNGTEINEPYLYPGAAGSDADFDVVVPEGKLWVLGDHRNASGDSRSHQNGPNQGFVNVDDVVGRAEVIAWPMSRWGSAGTDNKPFEDVPEP